MITVSQLAAFDPAPWTSVADWSRSAGMAANETQQELEAQAAAVERAWPGLPGQLAAAKVRDRADAHGELATAYCDAATVIDEAADEMCGFRDEIIGVQGEVAATPHLNGPDDAGKVTSTYPFSVTKFFEWLHHRSLAKQETLKAREILMKADGSDRQATLGLNAVMGMDLPPTDDGPIDLTDEGIELQADLNNQDRYGDCTTLSTLISLAHADPSFIREHMKWDPDTHTYEVTLYDDDGNPVTVNVDPDEIPADGSDMEATGKPNWISIYEQAIQQQHGDIKNGQWEDVPIRRITGQDVPVGPPPSVDDIRDGMNQDPPPVMTADTVHGSGQPDDVDPSKRVVPNHTYAVRGVDDDGNVILQNPWGPDGGWGADGKYYPGEVRLTPEEYEKWFGNGATLNPPF